MNGDASFAPKLIGFGSLPDDRMKVSQPPDWTHAPARGSGLRGNDDTRPLRAGAHFSLFQPVSKGML